MKIITLNKISDFIKKILNTQKHLLNDFGLIDVFRFLLIRLLYSYIYLIKKLINTTYTPIKSND